MINQNSPPNLLINVIQKKYNSFNGVISNKINKVTTYFNVDSTLLHTIFGLIATDSDISQQTWPLLLSASDGVETLACESYQSEPELCSVYGVSLTGPICKNISIF